MTDIYTDNGSDRGLRTRFFRQAGTGIEWMFAADYAGPSRRWYGYGMTPDTIENMKATGMELQLMWHDTEAELTSEIERLNRVLDAVEEAAPDIYTAALVKSVGAQ